MFAPEFWGQVGHFSRLYSETFSFKEVEKRALGGVSQHFDKAATLRDLAVKLRPNLDIDRAELIKNGFTPALNATEFSAVIEAAILELYSSVDCTAKVLHAIYAKHSRKFSDSTRKLFSGFEKIEGEFPEQLKKIFRSVTWYEEFRFLRDELTHLETGSCTLNHETGKVQYMHPGIKKQGNVLVLEDVFQWFEIMMAHVNNFDGEVFEFLNSTLKDTPIIQICGMVEGRALMRHVNPAERLTFNSGTCFSRQWFELPENPTCPFVDACGAYRRTLAR
jgi:hypothetical protein